MLANIISNIFPSKTKKQAAEIYSSLVTQSRDTEFYSIMGVPDTLDGRFEMILLHMFIYLQQLKQQETNSNDEQLSEHIREKQRCIIEAFHDDMDRSLREIGVTDTGVKRRIKNMSAAFYGRMEAYKKALESSGKTTALEQAIRRNVYGTVHDDQIEPSKIKELTDYVLTKLRQNDVTDS